MELVRNLPRHFDLHSSATPSPEVMNNSEQVERYSAETTPRRLPGKQPCTHSTFDRCAIGASLALGYLSHSTSTLVACGADGFRGCSVPGTEGARLSCFNIARAALTLIAEGANISMPIQRDGPEVHKLLLSEDPEDALDPRLQEHIIASLWSSPDFVNSSAYFQYFQNECLAWRLSGSAVAIVSDPPQSLFPCSSSVVRCETCLGDSDSSDRFLQL